MLSELLKGGRGGSVVAQRARQRVNILDSLCVTCIYVHVTVEADPCSQTPTLTCKPWFPVVRERNLLSCKFVIVHRYRPKSDDIRVHTSRLTFRIPAAEYEVTKIISARAILSFKYQ